MASLIRNRLSKEEALHLLTEAPFLTLGQKANEARKKRFPGDRVTFVVDSNPNYTNVCATQCPFCAFYRTPDHSEAWTLSVEEVMARIENAVKKGATTILLQGGCHPQLPLDYYLSLVRETKKRFPDVTPHFFSAPEIRGVAETSGLTIHDVLARLKEAGQTSLPGGGAEILSERVRLSLSPKKGTARSWLDVHEEAHRLGFISTATMMFGHIETPDDIIDHLDRIRQLQDKSLSLRNRGGFTAFIPWSFKPQRTALNDQIPDKSGSVTYLRILAVARLFLDNIPHIQSSWFSEGKRIGQMALHFGCDDFGGTLFEENVHAETGHINRISREELIDLIQETGFEAVQRDTHYHTKEKKHALQLQTQEKSQKEKEEIASRP